MVGWVVTQVEPLRVPKEANAPTYERTLGQGHAFSAPQPLENAVLWHPAAESTFIYTPLDDRPEIRHANLAGIPAKFSVVRAGLTENYHLVWINDKAELWHAQLDPNGEFALSPVRISPAEVVDFSLEQFTDGGALIIWQLQGRFSRAVNFTALDALARPRNEGQLLSDSDKFTFATDAQGIADMLWTESDTDALFSVKLQVNDFLKPEPPNIKDAANSIQLEVADEAWLAELYVLREGQVRYVLWGISTAQHPEIVDYHLMIDDGQQQEISSLVVSGIDRLRWLGKVRYSSLFSHESQIVLTAFIDGTWHVLQLELTPDGVGDMKIIGNAPANASAPSLWIESSEKTLTAWVSLDSNLVSQQIIASTQVLASENQTERLFSIPTLTARRAINNLHYFPLGILWLLLPLVFLVTRWSAQYKILQIPVVIATYWLSKLCLSPHLVAYPPSGIDVGLSPASTIATSLLFLAILPIPVASILWQTGRWRSALLIYLLLEMVVSLMVLGINFAL